ncbi:MAG: Hsp20/alpha crystallin family protein [Actinomycetota bacterium]|nr:Hsp20/alpha crystallin family protein [Actinomycetota bacterium]
MLTRWNPWRDLFTLEREMSDLTNRFFGSGWFTPLARGTNDHTWAPAVDVFSRDGNLVVRAELAGIDPEKDVDITMQDGVLYIRGERRHEERTERDNYYRFESSYGSFQRAVPLPQGVNADEIQASYQNGILEVVVPKAGELTSAKKIPIAGGNDRQALTTEGHKTN